MKYGSTVTRYSGLHPVRPLRGHGLAQPAPYVKRKWSFEPSQHKRLLMGIIILVLILSGIGWAEQPRNGLFHSYVHNTGDDPVTLLWKPTAPNNDFAEFNGYSGNDGGKATYKANCFSGLACIDLGSTIFLPYRVKCGPIMSTWQRLLLRQLKINDGASILQLMELFQHML